jgi:hypothetical protein
MARRALVGGWVSAAARGFGRSQEASRVGGVICITVPRLPPTNTQLNPQNK